MEDVSLYLQAGANCFSRFMVLQDFGSKYGDQLEEGCQKAGRKLQGTFLRLPPILDQNLDLPFNEELNKKILIKFSQYYDQLKRKSRF